MKKTTLKIKDISTIAMKDEINIIETVAGLYFRNIEDDHGNIHTEYTPYLSKVGKIIAVAESLIDGVEFDEGEDVYESIMNSPDVLSLVNSIVCGGLSASPTPKSKLLEIQNLFNALMEQVDDIVEYRKAENIARIQNDSNAVMAYKLSKLLDSENEKAEKEKETLDNLNNWINEQRELNSLITPEMQKEFAETFNADSMMDAIIKRYSESDLHKRNQEIVSANKKIREMDNKIIEMKDNLLKEKQKDGVRNVISDKKKEE